MWPRRIVLLVLSVGLILSLHDMIGNRLAWVAAIEPVADQDPSNWPDGSDWRYETQYSGNVSFAIIKAKYSIGDSGVISFIIIGGLWFFWVASFKRSWRKYDRVGIFAIMLVALATSVGLIIHQNIILRDIYSRMRQAWPDAGAVPDFTYPHGAVVSLLGQDLDLTVRDPSIIVLCFVMLMLMLWLAPDKVAPSEATGSSRTAPDPH